MDIVEGFVFKLPHFVSTALMQDTSNELPCFESSFELNEGVEATIQ